MTREEWANEFLRRVGAPGSKRNLLVLVSWMQAEGNSARWNPLNTTLVVPGSTDLPGNTAGVQEYTTAEAGLVATARTLNFGADRREYGYRRIRHRLRQSKGSTGTLALIERSAWGTGGLGLLCLPWVKLRWNHYRNLTIKND